MLKRLKKEGKIELLSDDRAAFCVRSGEVHQKRSLIFRDEILLFLAKLYWCGYFSGGIWMTHVEFCYFWPSYIGGWYFSKGRGLHMLSPQLQLQTLQSSSFANSWFPKPRQMSITSTFNNPRELSRVILIFLQTCSISGFKKKGEFSIIGLNFAAEHIKAKLWDSFKRRKFMDAASNMPPLWMGFAKTWWYLATKTAPQKLYAPRYFQTTREQFWFRKKASLLNIAYHFDVIQLLYDHYYACMRILSTKKRGKSTERDVLSNGRGTIIRWNGHLNV